jgi:hypothetical protein
MTCTVCPVTVETALATAAPTSCGCVMQRRRVAVVGAPSAFSLDTMRRFAEL